MSFIWWSHSFMNASVRELFVYVCSLEKRKQPTPKCSIFSQKLRRCTGDIKYGRQETLFIYKRAMSNVFRCWHFNRYLKCQLLTDLSFSINHDYFSPHPVNSRLIMSQQQWFCEERNNNITHCHWQCYRHHLNWYKTATTTFNCMRHITLQSPRHYNEVQQ